MTIRQRRSCTASSANRSCCRWTFAIDFRARARRQPLDIEQVLDGERHTRKRTRILLLDEPFGALDAKVRKELRQWLRSLHSEIHVTSIFVTHDQEEALEVANRVVVMDKGRIEQIGTPGEVYDHPATAFVHGFIGESIVLPVDVRD